MKKETYRQAPMTNWYHPRMLLNIGLKAMISGTFGNYADRRELQAALDSHVDNDEFDLLRKEYCGGENERRDDIWIDVVNDTGDGFNATFAVARCVAKKALSVEGTDEDGKPLISTLPRAKILIFGGDEVYPFPTIEAYTNKFKIPFASAIPDREERDNPDSRPHLYAIPGNHDWYDGLGNFIKLFCQRRWIGIWSTKQHRSYFALPLPHGYWIWATDVQLNSDIDGPQLKYFEQVASKMHDGDKVILITAEPAWVYNKLKKGDRSFSKLEFFVERYICCTDQKGSCRFKLAATLTGDLHHYARYQVGKEVRDDHGHQYITAGGGGAFLHETHNLPKCVDGMDRQEVHLKGTFPSRGKSQGLMLWNFVFPFKNRLFTLLLFGIYLIFFMALHSNMPDYFGGMQDRAPDLASFFIFTGKCLWQSPGSILLSLAIATGFYTFADTGIMHPWQGRVAGTLHGIAQLVVLFLTMRWIGIWPLSHSYESASDWWLHLGIILMICIIGAIAAGLLFGTYLFISNLFGMHMNEASSSLACEDYKNFLRLRVHKDGVTIYPIGIRRVPRKWTTKPEKGDPDKPSDQRYSFEGSDPKAILIEPPIHIHNDKL